MNGVEWEPLQVPTMNSIRRLVSAPGAPPWPPRGEWGASEVFQVVQNRWRRAIRETCTHPHGFGLSLATNLFGEPLTECPRCHKRQDEIPEESER